MNSIKLTEQSFEIANYIYSILPDFPAEEIWNTVSKLRTSANDLVFYCAEAESDPDTGAAHYEWSRARKSASGLSILCRLSIKQGLFNIDPKIIVTLDKLSDSFSKKYALSKLKDDEREQKTMDNWLKRYKIWKETEL